MKRTGFLPVNWRYASSALACVAIILISTANAGESDHGNYAAALIYVDRQGIVDYRRLKENHNRLQLFIAGLASLRRTSFNNLSSLEWFVFQINVYNALMLQVVIENYPIEASFFGSWCYQANSIPIDHQ